MDNKGQMSILYWIIVIIVIIIILRLLGVF